MTPRYKLRTLLILLAVLPPLLWFGWTKYEAWRAEQERQERATQFAKQSALEQAAFWAALQAKRAALEAQIKAEMQARESAPGFQYLELPPVRPPNEL